MNERASAPRDRYDLSAFADSIGDVPSSADSKTLAIKSRDLYWFSPVLKRLLEGTVGDLVVSPRNEADVIRLAAAAAIADARAAILEESGGFKSADVDLLNFKREVDPLGIYNPGKMRTYVPVR